MSESSITPVRSGRGSGGVTGRGFQPGRSGNPAGQVRRTKDGRTVAQLARDLTEDALKVLCEIARNKKEPAPVRVQAALAIVNRGWSDAPRVQVHAEAPVERLSTRELLAIVQGLPQVSPDARPVIEAETASPKPLALMQAPTTPCAVPTNASTKEEV